MEIGICFVVCKNKGVGVILGPWPKCILFILGCGDKRSEIAQSVIAGFIIGDLMGHFQILNHAAH
jgi:hypothetical protein